MSVGDVVDDLLVRARAGDVAAFTSLLREHDSAMRAVVWSVVRDTWLMDDVLQNAYEKAYVGLAGFRGESSFRTWLHRICWTTAIDALRAEGRRRSDPLGDEADARPSPLPGPEDRAVDGITFRQAWERLSPDQRSAITLVLVEGLSYEEAGRVCGAPSGTVAARVSRGRARLADLLRDDGRGDPPAGRPPRPPEHGPPRDRVDGADGRGTEGGRR